MPTKIVVTGPVAAGKTTFVQSLGGDGTVSTEEASTHLGKETTTVAMDVGHTHLEGRDITLVGTPGQERFDYMWDVLASGADGVVLLIPADREAALQKALTITPHFESASPPPLGVGITRTDCAECQVEPAVKRALGARAVFIERVDARVPEECRDLLSALADVIAS
jgi:hypothetical protein